MTTTTLLGARLLATAALLTLAVSGCSDEDPARATDVISAATPTATATATADPLVPVAALMTPGDAAAVAGGSWHVSQPVQDGSSVLLIVCPTGDGYAGEGKRLSLESSSHLRVTNQVTREGSAAQGWLDALRDDITRCPHRAADSEDGKASETFALSGTSSKETVVVVDTYRDCDTCAAHRSLWVVTGVGTLMSYAHLDATQESHALGWAGVMRERLRAAGAA